MSADLIPFLEECASGCEATTALPSRWLENNVPHLMPALSSLNLLATDASPEYVEYGDETHRIHCLERGDKPLWFCFEDEEAEAGPMHFLTEEEQQSWRVLFTPLAELVRRELPCKGTFREVVPGFLWQAGTATQQAREIWLCRGSSPVVQEYLARLPKSALLFRLGHGSTSYMANVFLDVRLSDYLIDTKGTLSLDRQALSDAVASKLKANTTAAGEEHPAFGIQNSIQMRIENWIWDWFDARLKAAKIIERGEEDDPDAEVKPCWAQYDIISQKEICDRLNIPPKTFTRTKENWAKDVAGYGRFFLLIIDEFVRRRPRKDSETPENAAERLNDFYHLHREIIESARQHRAHNI